MIVKTVIVGNLEENCYVLIKDDSALVIDPGDEVDKIIEAINNKKLLGVLITHAHDDHIGALNELLKKYDVPVCYNNINNEINCKKLVEIKEEKYVIGNFKFDVIYTKGHRNDLSTFYFYEDNIMFTGDFLFHETIGRTDMEYGNILEMYNSIKKIKNYNDNIIIYPGHGIKTSLKHEKEYNVFFNEE